MICSVKGAGLSRHTPLFLDFCCKEVELMEGKGQRDEVPGSGSKLLS